jgi:L-asparaginase
VSELSIGSRRVAVVSTGGTIASVRSSASSGVAVGLAISELLEGIGDIPDVEIGPIEALASVNGWNVDPSLMLRVSASIRRLVGRPDVDGVVVTHGTDTVEETAFLADLTVPTDKPVVFAAAMRSADSTSPDGPHNLMGALRAAASPALRGMGAVVCLNESVHAARWARKSHSSRLDAFTSVPGPLATIDPDGEVRRSHGPLRRWTVADPERIDQIEPDVVPVLQAYTGMSARALKAAVDSAVRGLVIEGFGLGNLPGQLVDPIRELMAGGVVVVVSTRVPQGGTWPVYGGPGGGTELAGTGLLTAGGLTSAKARLLLWTCLAETKPAQAAQAARAFTEAVAVLGQGSGVESSWQ